MAFLWERGEHAAAARFSAEYVLSAPPAAAALAALDGQPLEGLLCHHWVEQHGKPGAHLVSYWRDRSAYEQERGELERRLGLSDPTYQGFVRQLQTRQPAHRRALERLRRGTHWGRNLLAIVGASTTLMPLYVATCARPMMISRLDCPRNVVAEDRFTGNVSLRNERGLRAKINLVTLNATPQSISPKPITLIFDAQRESVGAHGERELPFEGRLPTDGTYDLAGEVEVEAGLFDRRRPFKVEREIEVWSALPKIYDLALSGGGQSAVVTGRLRLGPAAPNGLGCEVHLHPRSGSAATTAATVRFGAVRFRGVTAWPPPEVEHDAAGRWTASYITWTTPPLPEFTERKLSVELESDQPIDWRELDPEVECSLSTEER